MLRRFFKGRDRLHDPDPTVRREAVLELDPVRAQARAGELAALLTGDPDRSVRLAVIERLEAIESLCRVLDDEAIGEAAARRVLALAANRGASLPEHPRLQALGLLQATPAEQQAHIAGIDDPEQLAALALKDRGALRAAVLAHPAMQTAAALAVLEKRSRGSDKSLNRHAREALDGLRRLQQQAAVARQRIEELVQSLGRTAAASERAAWERQVHLYRQCTQALADYDAARTTLASTFREALPALDDLRACIVPPPPEPVRATAPDPTSGRADVAQPQQASGAAPLPPPEPAPAVVAAPSAEKHNLPPTDEPDARAAAAAAAARQEELAALDKLLDVLEENLAAGHVAAARQQLTQARRGVDALGALTPRGLARRLNRLGGAFAELRDWQNYATAPKREALCDAVQALVDHPLAAPDQAERLKALRAAWRELGPIVQAADARLAERFDTLAEQAFEPCRDYFARQAEIRRANLVEHERICGQLAQYLAETDWQRADMKAAEQILRTAREAWRQYQPVDRGPGKALEARFEGLQEELHGRLKAFWDGNAEAKRQIVAEAEALATADAELEGRIDRVKGLQQRWRSIGPVIPRARDQALWSAFRDACDALFSARETARHVAEAEIRELAGQCAATLDAFDAETAALAPGAATEAQARVLRERLRALDGLPPQLRQPLAARRASLLARHEAILREQDRSARGARLEELRSRDEEFSAAEAAHRSGGPAPVAPEPCFANRLGRHADPVPLDELRRLTLRVEQAAGIAPPPEDASLRLEVQVERLRAGLGGADSQAPLELALRWCAIGPKDANVGPLRQRFFAALSAGLVETS